MIKQIGDILISTSKYNEFSRILNLSEIKAYIDSINRILNLIEVKVILRHWKRNNIIVKKGVIISIILVCEKFDDLEDYLI